MDFERRTVQAREEMAALDDRATGAIGVPQVDRRASLSNRGRRGDEDTDESRDAGQASLDGF